MQQLQVNQTQCQLILSNDDGSSYHIQNFDDQISEYQYNNTLAPQATQNFKNGNKPSNQTLTTAKLKILPQAISCQTEYLDHHTYNNSCDKQFRQLLIFVHVKRFAKRIIASIRPPDNFTLRHLQLIGDLGAYLKIPLKTNQIKENFVSKHLPIQSITNQIKIKWRMIKDQLHKFYEEIPLIEPNSRYKFIWDFVLCLIRIYLIIVIPIMISFQNTEISSGQGLIILVICVFLFFDIILRMFTISFDKGMPIKDKRILLQKQLNYYTYIEIISIIGAIIVSVKLSYLDDYFILELEGLPKLILLGLYLQINNIAELLFNLQYFFKPSKEVNSFIELMKLVIVIILIQHFCACIWVVIGQAKLRDKETSWMDPFATQSWSIWYLESLYFMSVTMFTVGYGDISPTNTAEKIFCICYMFLSTLELSYSVNTIGSILTQIKENNEKIRQKLTCINEYMQEKQISQSLQYKVREYCNFYLKEDILDQRNEQNEIIKQLPEDLQDNLRMEAAALLINQCSFFKENFSQSMLNKLLQEIEFETFTPGQIIKRAPEDFRIYIIEHGAIQLSQNKKVIQNFYRNQYFGLQEFINEQFDDESSYKTLAFTNVLVIKKSQLYRLLQHNQQELENFTHLTYHSSYKQYCYICKDNKHQSEKCNLVHYVPDKERIIKKYLYPQSQVREFKKRGRLRKFSSLFNRKTLEEIQQTFQIEKQELIDTIQPDINYDEVENRQEKEVKDLFTIQNNKLITNIGQQLLKPSILPQNINSSRTLLQQEEREEVNQLQVLRDQLSIKYKHLNRFQENLQYEIEYWYKRLDNDVNGNKLNLDRYKLYPNLFKKWNLDQVLSKLTEKRLGLNKESKLNKYVIYVWPFVKKYRIHKSAELSYRKVKRTKNQSQQFKTKNKNSMIHPI